MDPITSSITSFGISVAAGIVTDKLSQTISVDKEINQAFEQAKNDWTNHELSYKKEQELKQYLESAYNSPLFVNDSKGNEAEDFFNKFRKRLSGTKHAKNFLKEIVDENRFQEVINSIHRVEYKIDNLTALMQSLSTGEVQLTNDRINEICQPLIQRFKPQSALYVIDRFEKYISDNLGNISTSTRANIFYLKSVCFEALGKPNESHEYLVKAYYEAPDNTTYLAKTCSSYFIHNNNKFKELLNTLGKTDEYNPRLWVIKTLESDNVINYVQKEVPELVRQKIEFKRILFDRLSKKNSENVRDEIKTLDIDSLRIPVPEKITYDSLFHWLLILEYIKDAAIFSQPQIRFVGFLDKNEDILYFFQVVKMLNKNLANTEVKMVCPNVLSFYEHWLDSELNNNKESVQNLSNSYQKLTNKNTIYTMLLANSLQKYGDINGARKIIAEFEGTLHSQLVYLKTFIDLSSKNQTIFKDGATYFLDYEKKVDENNLYNYIDFLSQILASKVINEEQLLDSIKKIEVSNPDYKLLFELMVETEYKSDKVPLHRIDTVKNKLPKSSMLNHQITILYFLNRYFDEGICYIESFIDDSEYSITLGLYIQCLHHSENSDKLKLLRLLKQWRVNNYPATILFYRYELQAVQVLQQWDQVIEVADDALKHYPEEEYFYISLLNALDNNKDKERIEKEVSNIIIYNFNNQDWLIKVANLLLKYGFKEHAINLLYREAQNKDNSDVRMSYFSAVSTTELSEFLQQYDTVQEGHYVTYEVGGHKETIHVSGRKKELPIVKASIGKQVNATITFKKKMGSMLSTARIMRIGNKYLALFDEIMLDSESLNSEIPLLSLKLEDSNVESLNKVFIENFASQEEKVRNKKKENISDYYSYTMPFSVLVTANFNHSYIDAYLSLTSDNGFLVKPTKYLPNPNVKSNQKIAIDFSSGMLLFNLNLSLGLSYPDKFLISSNIYNLIDNLILEADSNKNSKASVEIRLDKVIPHFYDESFSVNRIKYLNKIKDWFLDNCISEIPAEKLNFHNKLQDSEVINPSIELVADYFCFAQRENVILITDDLALFQNVQPENVISTEKYLSDCFSNEFDDILEQMLSLKYVGISINENVLYNAFINQHKSDKKHIYNYALKNLGLKINYVSENIDFVLDFLRKVALNPSIDSIAYKRVATNVFIALIKSIPNMKEANKIQNKIRTTFRLFIEHESLTNEALLSALQIIKHS